MRYWLKLTGTREDPLEADWHTTDLRWAEDYDNAQMFSRRPSIEPSDRLVMYAVGSPQRFGAGRIFAVLNVTSDPRPSPHPRWPWEVEALLDVAGPRLERCPSLEELGVELRSLRQHSYIRLPEEQGERADELIRQAAAAHGSLAPE